VDAQRHLCCYPNSNGAASRTADRYLKINTQRSRWKTGAANRFDQCDELPSSLLLVANRIEAAKTAIMTGTTKKGEVMLIRQSP
jgi:hypothetical protein